MSDSNQAQEKPSNLSIIVPVAMLENMLHGSYKQNTVHVTNMHPSDDDYVVSFPYCDKCTDGSEYPWHSVVIHATKAKNSFLITKTYLAHDEYDTTFEVLGKIEEMVGKLIHDYFELDTPPEEWTGVNL